MKKQEIVAIARVCHEANRAYCETIGDTSNFPWRVINDTIKGSIINGVENVLANVLANDTTPKESHENWMEYKLEEGWVYGLQKDLIKKTHPCLVDYADLPTDQKIKDHLFVAIVMAFQEKNLTD